MCLRIVGSRVRYKIADKDIVVYKRLEMNNVSPYYSFRYKENQTYTTKNPMRARSSLSRDVWYIYEGIHAYTTFHQAKWRLQCKEKVVEMIIPKWTRYVIGGDDEVVSDRIRVKSLVKL